MVSITRVVSRATSVLCCALLGTVWVPGVAHAAVQNEWAVVDADGTLVRGSGATNTVHLVTGGYAVKFDHDVTACAYEATPGSPGTDLVDGPIEITVSPLVLSKRGVLVKVWDQTTSELVDRPFHLAVYCRGEFAVLDSDGSTEHGSHVVSSNHAGTGAFFVRFDRDVSQCAYLATIGSPTTFPVDKPGEITVASLFGEPNGVFIQVVGLVSDTAVDLPFHLAVDCGAKRDIAVVTSGGSKVRGTHVTSVDRVSTGLYDVFFDHKVSKCAYTATIGETGDGGSVFDAVTISTAGRAGRNKGVTVEILDTSGTPIDEPFHLRVTC